MSQAPLSVLDFRVLSLGIFFPSGKNVSELYLGGRTMNKKHIKPYLLIFTLLVLSCCVSVAWCHDGIVVAACDVVGITGDFANSRGLRFEVDTDFASIEVRMLPTVSGMYEFTAELRRSVGFVDTLLAAVRISASLTADINPPYTTVHMDFPPIPVSGTETFTLRFMDFSGPGSVYFETAGIGNYPCPAFIVTEGNTQAEPVIRSSATGMRILAPPSGCPGDCPGDINGDRKVNMEDLAILSSNWLKVCAPVELPVLTLQGSAIDESIAKGIAKFFKIDPAGLIGEDGILRYTNPELFHALPMIPMGEDYSQEDSQPIILEAINFEAITGEVLEDKIALRAAAQALSESGFILPEALQAATAIDHTMFHAVHSDGKQIANAPLDTHVDYGFRIGEIPVMGPGAKFKFVLNARGQLAHLTMALPAVQGTGQVLPLLSQEQADSLALQAYAGSPAPASVSFNLSSQVVYWIPATAGPVTQLVPQFLYGGTMTDLATGQVSELRKILIPAVSQNAAPQLVPQVQLWVDPAGYTIYAGTEVSGGTPPYTYSWSSSTTDLSGQTGSMIQYDITIRKGQPVPEEETVTVVVTDAAGLSTTASETVSLFRMDSPPTTPAPMVGGVTDVGTEWIGVSQGLGGSAANAGGFVTRFLLSGTTVRFNWGDYNAWERDFKDPSIAGGDDTNWIDNVDAAFYTGHANGDGFTFSSNVNDGFLHYNDARWGNNDLEWIVIAACGPLQLNSGGKSWHQRWGPAFQGVHLICAYQTSSSDNTVEGLKYANYLLSGKTVRQAWINTAVEVQPGGVKFGVMGVIGKNGMSNYNDHFWGKGSVGPDIRGSNIVGYWLVYGPC